jgi:hypothetical protein
MAEFDYKQRPFSRSLTDEEYDRATGRTPKIDTALPALPKTKTPRKARGEN